MDIKEKIQSVIDCKVNPVLNSHNGSVVFSYLNNDILGVKFYGACATCMSLSDTFNDVVKTTLMEELPEIKDVIIDNSVSQDLIDMAKKILNKEI